VKVADSLERAQLMRIADDVGSDWKMLSRYLGLEEIAIKTINRQAEGDLREASLQSLLK